MKYDRYEIKPVKESPSHYTIKTIGGGSIPGVLDGMFTSYHECVKQIKCYLSSRKEVNNAKAKSTGGN